ncbi:hypothetical protein [Bacillus piscicola]|nr:hypothetical protein [Bacillus piscicola]
MNRMTPNQIKEIELRAQLQNKSYRAEKELLNQLNTLNSSNIKR